MSDARTTQIERDNTEVLHFLETAFRWLMNTLKAVFMVIVLVVSYW